MSTVSALGIDQAELSLFQELKEVMAKHTKVKRKFGIALEHEHFPYAKSFNRYFDLSTLYRRK
jgi:gamma-glutamylcysteine synthetase